MLKVISMAHINNFTDMINALPKQEMDSYQEELESPVSPPVSTPTSEPPIIVDRFSTPNGITSISSGEIILPKRSQITDLLKNGPLSAAICGDPIHKGGISFPRSTPIMHSSASAMSHSVPQYVQSLINPPFVNVPQKQPSHYQPKSGRSTSALVKIVEQPAENRVRFRFPIEGRSAGSIAGVSATAENKTFPTVEIVGYKGPAKVVVSCVEDKFYTDLNGYKTYRAHPHNLVGKHCKEGVCIMDVNEETMTCQFSNIGVQCVTKRQIEASLQIRKRIQVDPFGLGFDHKNSDRTTVRLCFQVFLKPKEGGLVPLLPVVSSLIKDKRAHPDLNVVDMSDDTSPVEGGKKILLFCSKIKKEDIEVLFLHYGKNGEEILTTKGEFGEANVHDQSGISFRTPPYPDLEIKEPAKVSICLRQPSKNVQSEPQDFWYVPSSSKVTSIDNDLKQKILMIQRIAEEAKLTDLDIKKEENVSYNIPRTSKTGAFTPPPTSTPRSSDTSKTDRFGKLNRTTPDALRNVQKAQVTFKNIPSDSTSKGHSRFPLTGSYGGIISTNSECMEKERTQNVPTDDSGFMSGQLSRDSGESSRSVMLQPNKPPKKSSMNHMFQQEQQHLANCVRLIAADMEEFEKEPDHKANSLSPPQYVPTIVSVNPHANMIPNQEIFRGTCADERIGLNINSIKFPTQPLDLSTLSTSAGIVSNKFITRQITSQPKKLQNQEGKIKRKRARKQTEPSSMNIMPMTPMPHTTKTNDMEEEKDPSVDSGLGSNSSASERSITPKKRKRTPKLKVKDTLSENIITPSSVESHHKLSSPPSLVPINPSNFSRDCLSMPVLGDIPTVNTNQNAGYDTFSIKKEHPDYDVNESDRELGLVIDTDGEED